MKISFSSLLRVSAPPREPNPMIGCALTPGNLFTRRRGGAEKNAEEES